MLFSIDDNDNEITEIPRRRKKEFNLWRNNLADEAYEAVIDKINEYIDAVPADKPFISSFIPGNDWRGTVYEPLYLACGRSKEQSGWFFGLIVWQVMINREEEWYFKLATKDDDILGTTYWRRS